MARSDWSKWVKDAIAHETGAAADGITDETTAIDVPGWDSLTHVRIMFRIEATSGQSVDMDASYQAETVGELIDLFSGETAT